MPLAEELSKQRQAAAAKFTAERQATMEGATVKLHASGIEGLAVKENDSAPEAILPNAKGQAINLAQMYGLSPTIVIFYRGGWCPYCNLTLRAYQSLFPEIKAAGVNLVAVSPEMPDKTLTTAQKNELTFQVLSDPDLKAAAGFGLAFELPDDLAALYVKNGNDLRIINGTRQFSLPVPATYVSGRDGVIAYAHGDADYRNRAEPSDVLEAAKRLLA
jgi:peroxiredoxin